MESIKDQLKKIKDRKPSSRIHTRHQDLAVQIAQDFGDMKHIGVYMRICKKFDDSFVRRMWAITKEISPANKGKYFTSAIYKEAKKQTGDN